MESSNALLYGKGIFTTAAIRNGVPVLWEKHWRRLMDNAEKIGIDISGHSSEDVLSMLGGRLANARIVEGRARITFLDKTSSELWTTAEPNEDTLLQIIVGRDRPVPSPFGITISPHPVNSGSPLAGVKSCNYLEQLLTKDEAKRRGFHEAIRVNEHGHVTSGCMANVFWLKGARLYTSALSTGCLPGTTREYLLENLECEEVEAQIGELETAEAIFLTSAGLGVVALDEYNGRALVGTDHPIVRLGRDLEIK
jgi:branched-subunit amino acid aminotransferase/4-amino-4-deoxychorismate lyase